MAARNVSVLRIALAVAAMLVLASAQAAEDELLLLLDPTRLSPTVASRGAGPDGRWVRPRAVAAACVRDGVYGPAAFSPSLDRCRSASAVPGLAEAAEGLLVQVAGETQSVIEHVAAGGIVAVAPRLGLACLPGNCDRRLFEDASYPTALVNRPQPPMLPEPRIDEFSIDPDLLVAGESAELQWSAASIEQCRLDASDGGGPWVLAAAGTRSVLPRADTVWTLTCSGPGGTAVAQVSAAVTAAADAPRILLFEATRDDVPVGGRTTLVLEAMAADGCILSDGQATLPVEPSARVSVRIEQATLFEAVCQSASGSVMATTEVAATVAAGPPVIEVFEFDRGSIARGDSVGLDWRVDGATRCRLREAGEATVWRLAPAGRRVLAPAESTEYGLECRNAFGTVRRSTSVTVSESGDPLRLVSMTLSGPSGSAPRGGGEALQLDGTGLIEVAWETNGAQACRMSDDLGREDSVPASGSRTVGVSRSLALQIDCVGNGAQLQAVRNVRVRGEAVFFDGFER